MHRSSAASKPSLCRIANYDYWSDKVRRSILLDARADLLLQHRPDSAVVSVEIAGGKKQKILPGDIQQLADNRPPRQEPRR